MVNLRFEAVAEAFRKRPLDVAVPQERPSEYFAKKVFNRQKMSLTMVRNLTALLPTMWLMP